MTRPAALDIAIWAILFLAFVGVVVLGVAVS